MKSVKIPYEGEIQRLFNNRQELEQKYREADAELKAFLYKAVDAKPSDTLGYTIRLEDNTIMFEISKYRRSLFQC